MPEQDTDQRVEIETNVGRWHDLLKVLGAIDPEHRLRFGEGGIGVTTVDFANVAVVDVSMPAGGFEEYEASTDEGEVGVNGDAMQESMPLGFGGGVSRRDTALVSVDDEETKIEIKERNNGYVKRTITFGTIHSGSLRPEPNIDGFDGREWRMSLPASDFVHAIDAFDQFTIHPTFETCPDGLRLHGEKGDSTAANGRAVDISLDADTEKIGEGTSTPDASSIVSINYLADIADAIHELRASTRVIVEFGDVVPIRIGVQRPDDETVGYECSYHVAPRLKSGDSYA